MAISLFKALSIGVPSIMGATIIVVPSIVAASEEQHNPTIKEVQLNKYEDHDIYSDFVSFETNDHFVDFTIDLTLLKEHEVSIPNNFLKVEDENGQAIKLSNLQNVFLNEQEVLPVCFEIRSNGIKFTRPIFNINIDYQLIGRITFAHKLEKAESYKFIWTFN